MSHSSRYPRRHRPASRTRREIVVLVVKPILCRSGYIQWCFYVTYALDPKIVLGSIVIRSPACQLSASAMSELDLACNLMEHKAASGRSAKAVVREHPIWRCTVTSLLLLTILLTSPFFIACVTKHVSFSPSSLKEQSTRHPRRVIIALHLALKTMTKTNLPSSPDAPVLYLLVTKAARKLSPLILAMPG